MPVSDDALFVALVAFGCALAALPLWLLVRGVKQGVWNGRGVDVFRNDRPLAFWFGIVMYGVIAVILLSFPLYMIWTISTDG